MSRGSPEQVNDGWRYFGFEPVSGETDADMACRHIESFLRAVEGAQSTTRLMGSIVTRVAPEPGWC